MSNSQGVEINGTKIKLNGQELSNVTSITYRADKDSLPTTTIEVDGDFDFKGLSGVEVALHPLTVYEAVKAIEFMVSLDDKFARKFKHSIVRVLDDMRNEKTCPNGELANMIMMAVLEGLA